MKSANEPFVYHPRQYRLAIRFGSVVVLLLLSLVAKSTAQVVPDRRPEKEAAGETGVAQTQDSHRDNSQDVVNSPTKGEVGEVGEVDRASDQRVTREEISAAAAQLAAKEGLDEGTRETISKLLQAASLQLDSYDNFQSQIVEYDKQIARLPESLRKLQARKDETLEAPENWIVQRRSEELDLDGIRELIRGQEAELEKLNKTLTSRRAEAERRPIRLTEIPTRISELESKIGHLDQQLKLAPPADEMAELIIARSIHLRAELTSSEKEIELLKKEQDRYRAGRDLLPLQVEFAQKDIQYRNRILSLLKELLEERQTAQFRAVREESIRRIEETWPMLRAFVEHDLYDMAQIEESAEQTRKSSAKIDETVSVRRHYEAEFKGIQERFRTIGGSSALGTVLRSSKKELDQKRSAVSSEQTQDERRRVATREQNELLKNELPLMQDSSFIVQRLVESALSTVGRVNLSEPAQTERVLTENNFEIARVLSGMPVAGIQHEESLAKLASLIAKDIAELKPSISAKIANVKQIASPWGFNRNTPQAKDLAVRLFLFQSKKGELSPEEQAWLQEVGWESLVEIGEQAFVAQAEQLVAARSKIIQKQLGVIEDENVQLANLDLERQSTLQLISQYMDWIDERVIWIRSTTWPQWNDLIKVKQAAIWFLSPNNWISILNDLSGVADERGYVLILIGIISVLALFVFRIRLKKLLRQNGELATKRHCLRIAPTTKSLVITIALAAIWPLTIFLIGRLLEMNAAVNSFGWSVGQSLIGVSYLIAALEMLRAICSESGLANAHFGWPERTRIYLRSKIRSFYVAAIPLLFIQGVLLAQPNEDYQNSLGRLASCLLFIVVAVYLHWIFRPRGVMFQQMAMANQLMPLYSMRRLIYLLALVMPMGLLIFAISGYYYTACQLGASLEKSMSFIVVILLVGGFLFRWLLVTRRSKAMDEARRIRQEMEAKPERAGTVADGSLTPIEQLMEELVTVNRQSREVVVSLLWIVSFLMLFWIWRDMLPAVGILNRYPLWTAMAGNEIKDVTLMSLLNASLTILITWMLIRNMPGLLNMAVQTYSTLDSGARYAATTLFRYVITIIGTVTALSFLHIQWAQYGWLIAAVSVGLGFGLQEIVANFVSGIILLFERPVRIGDTITIDGQNGMVTRIHMRATTIRTWDFQELIIPNKDLMTGKLLNWTLTNSTNRLVLKVGVAYGSDPDRVRDILYGAVLSHPAVVKDPAPSIGMDEFGDSAMIFSIRCLLESMDGRVQVRHELNAAVARALGRAEIVIPFPQLDLHVVSNQQV